ncbi:MAG: hypothetical protein QG635_2129 [Bacteroidota bacterium]|nr:hypothetical protein [Bacteroidota bacterium]
MQRNSLGAAIIAKNSAVSIKKAILSVGSIVRQIVVVDTGSDDGTPVLCSRLGCEVHLFRWCDDFSAARNYALSKMRTEWIISIDSDEALDIKSYESQSELLCINNYGGINTILYNYLDPQCSNISKHRFTRIFRNHPKIRYSGIIHEQIRPSIESLGLEIIDSDIIIEHFGYSEIGSDKLERNIRMLAAELTRQPGDGWLQYHLGETYFTAKNMEDAKLYFVKSIDSGLLSSEQQEKARLRLAQIALQEEDFDTVNKRTSFISRDKDIEGFRKYILATGLLVQKRFKDAFALYISAETAQSSLVDKGQLGRAIELIKKVNNDNN